MEVVTWPLCAHCVIKTSNNNVLLHSVDKNACIELMSNGRVFTVTYWTTGSSSKRHGNIPEIEHGILHHLVTQQRSVSDVPNMWTPPLELLVTAARNGTECCHNNKQVFGVLPKALPIMCRNVHLHHWEKVIL